MPSSNHENTQQNAMTEIALALAMGFFSIMVLTLISFGAPNDKAVTIDTASLVPTNAGTNASTDVTDNDLIVIFHQGTYLDRTLEQVSPAALAGHPGRVVLAIDPATSLDLAIDARKAVKAQNLIVTKLDASWVKALADRERAEP